MRCSKLSEEQVICCSLGNRVRPRAVSLSVAVALFTLSTPIASQQDLGWRYDAGSSPTVQSRPEPMQGPRGSSLWPTLIFGRAWQDSPITNESGLIIGLQFPINLSHLVALMPGVEFGRTHQTSGIDICAPVGAGSCLARPDAESVVAVTGGLKAQLPGSKPVRPYVFAGGALTESLATSNPGEKQRFLSLEFGAGVSLRTGVGEWSVIGRWRDLPRWQGRDSGHQIVLGVGYRPGMSRSK